MKSYTAILFPAFVTDFIGCENAELKKMGIEIGDYLQKAGLVLDLTAENLLKTEGQGRDQELNIQYLTYIYSCAFSDAIRERKIPLHYVSAYSMGIYAALYHSGSLPFSAGLMCIREAFRSISETLSDDAFSMGLVGGLDRADIDLLKTACAPECYIVNSNNQHTFVFSGPEQQIRDLLTAARNEGALMTRMMEVSIPYHSPYLCPAADRFAVYLENTEVTSTSLPYLSSLSLQWLSDPAALRAEMARNLHQPFQWFESVKLLLSSGVKLFIECGAGEGLSKINKFINGDYRTLNLKNFLKNQT